MQEAKAKLLEAIGLSQAQFAAGPQLDSAALVAAVDEFEGDCRLDAEVRIDELEEALRLTQEYVGDEMLPRLPGWSWYDALHGDSSAVRKAVGMLVKMPTRQVNIRGGVDALSSDGFFYVLDAEGRSIAAFPLASVSEAHATGALEETAGETSATEE